LKTFTTNNLFEKATKLWGLNSVEDIGEIEEIKSLMVNLHTSKNTDQNEKDTRIWGWYWSYAGKNCIKLKVRGQLGM